MHGMGNPIFMYHGTPAGGVRVLERQLRTIAQWCEVVPLAEIVSDPARRGKRARRRAALTFDDGLRSNVTVAYPLLRRLSLHATFFVCPALIERGEWLWTHEMRQRILGLDEHERGELALGLGSPRGIDGMMEWMKTLPLAERRRAEAEIRTATPRFRPSEAQHEEFDLASWRELKALDPSVVSLGSHSMSHPILTSLSAEETESEIGDSRRAIEEQTGRAADLFCYPNGNFGAITLDAVRRHYRAAVTESERALPYWDPHRVPRVSEDRTGLRGWLGLMRKILFPYPRRMALKPDFLPIPRQAA